MTEKLFSGSLFSCALYNILNLKRTKAVALECVIRFTTNGGAYL